MQPQPFLTNHGQEVQFVDINRLGQVASHADDVAISVGARLQPTGGSGRNRAILPFIPTGLVDNTPGTVASATGGVLVRTFTAYAGSSSTDPSDIRTAIYQQGSVTTLAAQTAGAGTFRIDLVYATLMIDQSMPGETRYVKDPVTGALTSPTVPVQKYSYVVVGVQPGVASSTPSPPATPSDPPGGVNIPLAYVKLANGFGTLTVVTDANIMDIATTVPFGAQPVSSAHDLTGSFFTGTSKSKFFCPPTALGTEQRFGGLDTSVGSINNAILDNSIDWRNRIIRVEAQTGAAGENFAWQTASSSALPAVGVACTSAIVNSFPVGAANKTIYTTTNGGGTLSLYVDAANGALKVSVTGTPAISAFFVLTAFGQVPNT